MGFCRAQTWGSQGRASRAPPVVALAVCMNNEGQPWVSSVVRKIRPQIMQDPSLNHEYRPVMGMKSFVQASLQLLFGKHSPVIVENRVRRATRTRGGAIRDCTILNLKGTWDGSLALTPEAQRPQSSGY